MLDMGARGPCLRPPGTATPLHPWRRSTLAVLGMTGRSTLLGLARGAGKGGSARTVQRLFSTVLPWARRCWVCCRPPVDGPDAVARVAGDAVLVTHAGQNTHGRDRGFSRVSGQPGPGLACYTWSLGRVQQRRSLPRRSAQGGRSEEEQAGSLAPAAATQPQSPSASRRPGRPKGSPHPTQTTGTLPPELVRITAMRAAVLPRSAPVLSVPSLGLDGPCGTPPPCRWPGRAPCPALPSGASVVLDGPCGLPSPG